MYLYYFQSVLTNRAINAQVTPTVAIYRTRVKRRLANARVQVGRCLWNLFFVKIYESFVENVDIGTIILNLIKHIICSMQGEQTMHKRLGLWRLCGHVRLSERRRFDTRSMVVLYSGNRQGKSAGGLLVFMVSK
jgi:hypothetical protein